MLINIYFNTAKVIYNDGIINNMCKSASIQVFKSHSPWTKKITVDYRAVEEYRCLDDGYFKQVTANFKEQYQRGIKLFEEHQNLQKQCMDSQWYQALIPTAINIIMDPLHPHEAIKKSTDQYNESLKTHCEHPLDIYIGTTKEEVDHSHDINVFVDL